MDANRVHVMSVDLNQVSYAIVQELECKLLHLLSSDMSLTLCCRDVGLYGQSGSFEMSGAQHASSKP